MEEIWSKKYERWMILKKEDKILGFNIYKFGSTFYYNKSKDIFIHKDHIDEYVKRKKDFQKKAINNSYIEKPKIILSKDIAGGFDELVS